MKNLLSFLGEAWPPSKKSGPPSGGQKSPFGNRVGPQNIKPKGEATQPKGLTPERPAGPPKKSLFGAKSSKPGEERPELGNSEQEDSDLNGGSPFGQEQGPMDAEAIQAQAEIEQQQMEMEQELARQKAEKEAMERQEIKNMRAQAEDDVMAALDDKYNSDTDVIEFYPDMLTFTQYNDEQREKQMKERGKVETSPAEGGAAAIGSQTSSDIETGDKGETPKLPDAAKTKDDLKKKKITGQMSDDMESGAEVPPSELDEPEDEEDEDDEETIDEKTPEEEKSLSQNTGDPGLHRQRVFKIKPAEHVHGSDYVGQGEAEDELDKQFGDEEDDENPLTAKSKSKAVPAKSPEEKDEDDSEEEQGNKLKKNKSKDVNIKRFSESGWQGQ